MFATTLLRIVGWTHLVLVALAALFVLVVGFTGAAGVPGGLGADPLASGLLLLYGSAAGAVLIALADITEDVRGLRRAVAPADERRGLAGILRQLEPRAQRDPDGPRPTPGARGSFGSGGTTADR